MKTLIHIITVFFLLFLSSCGKLEYEYNNGIKIKRKDFKSTIDGTWQVEQYIVDAAPYDLLPGLYAQYGQNVFLTIDYQKTMTLEWNGYTNVYELTHGAPNDYYNLFSLGISAEITDTIKTMKFMSAAVSGEIEITELTKSRLRFRTKWGALRFIKH